MSTAELIYSKAKTLPDSAQTALLQLVELLAKDPSTKTLARIEPGSAQGFVSMAEDFDATLVDFEPYIEMNVLLDTHTFLWFIANDPRLSSHAQALIQDPGNRRWLSIADLWEMAIKVSLGKLTLAQPFDKFIPRQLQLNQIEVLVIELPHLAAVVAMPFHHRDPFGRLMAAQCQIEDFPIISADPAFDAYSIRRVWG